MDRLHRAIKGVHRLDDLAARDTALTRLPPLAKLVSVLVYLAVTLSFPKYDLTGVLGMALWPILLYEIDDLPLLSTLWQARAVVALLALVGAANLFFDRAPVLALGPLVLSGGVVTLLVLVIKGVLCFLAVYLLIAATGMERVCAALRQLHVPRVLVTTILLTYRYIVLLLQEADRISTAYALRAPGQKGIAFKAWGSLLGQLLLRSLDRAQLVYESMMLRGYGWRDDRANDRGVGAGLCSARQPCVGTSSRESTARGKRPRADMESAPTVVGVDACIDPGIVPPPQSTRAEQSPAPTRQSRKGAAFFAITVLYCLLFRTIPIFELLGELF